MSRLLKSQGYLMKSLGFILLFGFIYLGTIGGCNTNNGGGGSSQDTQALTENDFANDPNLFANPEAGVVVSFLEHPDSEEPDNDTGEAGSDVIPHRYTQTLNHTYCFTDDNDASEHFMILRNSDGEEVLRALANGGCVTEVIKPGDYEVVLTHGEHVTGTDSVFLIPASEDGQVTKRYEFDQKGIKTAKDFSYKMHRYIPGGLVKFFENISNVFTRRAIAQTGGDPSVNLTTLISINKCPGCNLMGVDLSEADLFQANLTGANLEEANLTGTDLNEANLTGANLTDANLTGANLILADLTSANLTDAILFEAILGGANLTGADLTGADLTSANLDQAILTDTILTDAILSFATWIDGNTCDVLSIGMCNIFSGNPNPCPSLTPSGNIVNCLLPSTDNFIDLVGIAHQLKNAGFSPTPDTIIWIQAWGANGARGENVACTDIAGCGGAGGAGGFAQTITTIGNFVDSAIGFGTSGIFYYLGKEGEIFVGGQGGTSTLVTFKNLENNNTSDLNLENDVLLIAGGGGGGGGAGLFFDGRGAHSGGLVIAFGDGIGHGAGGNGNQCTGGSDSGAGIGGLKGNNDSTGGSSGIGGKGGSPQGFLLNDTWLNGTPNVGGQGQGGDAGVVSSGGGGGGGYGGGGGEGGDDSITGGCDPDGSDCRGFGGCGGGSFANSKDHTLDISDTTFPPDATFFILSPFTRDGGVVIVFEL